MSLKLNAFHVFTFDSSSLSTLENVSFHNVAIPEDIGEMERYEGFVPVVGTSYAIKCEDGYFLRAARASKSVNKASLKKGAAAMRQNPDVPDDRVVELARLQLLRETPQSETSYPIFFDSRSGLALICTSSAAQAQKAFMQLQTIAPHLKLKPVNASNLCEQLSAWVEGTKPVPSGLSLGTTCELRSFEDLKKRMLIEGETLDEDVHLRRKIRLENWAVVRLGLYWTDELHFFINEDLMIDGVKLTPKGIERFPEGGFHEDLALHEAGEYGRAWIDLLTPLCAVLVENMVAASSEAAESAKALFEGQPFIFRNQTEQDKVA